MGIEINKAECKEVAPGVLKKNAKTFYIQCTVAKTWHYCNAARLNKLKDKHGSLKAIGAKYVSRNAKKEAKAAEFEKHLNIPEQGKYQSKKSYMAQCAAARKAAEEKVKPKRKRTYSYLEKPPMDISHLTQFTGKHRQTQEHLYPVFSENGTKCIQRTIMMKNEGWCNGCPWWHICKVKLKDWQKFREQGDRMLAIGDLQFTACTYDAGDTV